MSHSVVHFELNGPNADAAARFYAELFGWHPTTIPGGYVVVDTHGGAGINGGIGTEEGEAPNVRIYVDADDIQALLDRAEALGGRVTQPIREIPGVVTFAVFADPAGNQIGVVQSGEGPGVSEGTGAPMDWFEILGPDPKALWSFYRELFGWDVHEGGTDEFAYGEVHPERGSGGGIGSSPDGEAHVNVYARVADVPATLDRAQELGGTTIVPATKMGDGLTFGQFTDPQGTRFGVYARP